MLSNVRAAAELLLLEAEELERAGRPNEAVEAYRKAFKLCPELAVERQDEEKPATIYDPIPFDRLPPKESSFRTFNAADLYDDARKAEPVEFLEREGYVVIDGVLSDEEVKQAWDHFALFLSSCGIDIADKDSMGRMVGGYSSLGIVSRENAGHSRLNWFVRSRQHVKQAFRTALGLGNDAKLITSYDGFNYFRNPETNMAWHGETKPWFHFDAGNRRTGQYLQGVVNLKDTTEASEAGLVLLPRSHETVFPRMVDLDGPPSYLTHMSRREWALLRQEPVGETAFRVPMKAGSIVLWRSAVMHCNTACLPRAAELQNSAELVRRLAVYVCMCEDPRDPRLTEQRLRYFHEGRTTCHQPDVLRGPGCSVEESRTKSGAVVVRAEDLPSGAQELL